MLEIVKNIFIVILYLLGIVAAISLMISFIEIPIKRRRKEKTLNETIAETKEKLDKSLDDLTEKLTEALLKEDEETKKKSTRK